MHYALLFDLSLGMINHECHCTTEGFTGLMMADIL
jgi:hypothetical protein